MAFVDCGTGCFVLNYLSLNYDYGNQLLFLVGCSKRSYCSILIAFFFVLKACICDVLLMILHNIYCIMVDLVNMFTGFALSVTGWLHLINSFSIDAPFES